MPSIKLDPSGLTFSVRSLLPTNPISARVANPVCKASEAVAVVPILLIFIWWPAVSP